MTFDNRLIISVQFGGGNYCSNRTQKFNEPAKPCPNAEIAIWDYDNEDEWFNFGHDTVKGWVTIDDVAKWVAITQQATNLEHLDTLARLHKLLT